MASLHDTSASQLPDINLVHPEVVAPETRSGRAFRYVFAVTRISLGWVFLWAFLDKTFALGFATGVDSETGAVDRFGPAAWVNGGDPTVGFLTYGTKGPFAEFFQGLAGSTLITWLYMIGMLCIGLALIFGITMRIAAVAGVLMMAFIYAAQMLPTNNPVVDQHVIYALLFVALPLASAGHTLGLGKRWEKIPIVTRNGFLK